MKRDNSEVSACRDLRNNDMNKAHCGFYYSVKMMLNTFSNMHF